MSERVITIDFNRRKTLLITLLLATVLLATAIAVVQYRVTIDYEHKAYIVPQDVHLVMPDFYPGWEIVCGSHDFGAIADYCTFAGEGDKTFTLTMVGADVDFTQYDLEVTFQNFVPITLTIAQPTQNIVIGQGLMGTVSFDCVAFCAKPVSYCTNYGVITVLIDVAPLP